jgi:predicted ATP-dependent endonuclease of OLD family
MKLKTFRITNFKTIEDSGVITCHDVTAFVGKNEAGKTSLLRALSKLKPTDGVGYDGLREFPRKRFTDEFKKADWPVVEATFVLDAAETASLAQVTPLLAAAKEVEITRSYSGRYSVGFTPIPKGNPVAQGPWATALKAAVNVVDGILPKMQDTWTPEQQQQAKNHWATSQKAMKTHLQAEAANPKTPDKARITATRDLIVQHTQEEWSRTPMNTHIAALNGFVEAVENEEKLGSGRQWVVDHMPSFLYFDDYNRLGADIYLPEFLRRIESGTKAAETRVQMAVFKHVNAEIKELTNLGVHNRHQTPGADANIQRQIDELNIRANSAEMQMTEKFTNWWLQRRHRFHYQFNGDYFRIWVSDDQNESKVEFEQRSQGFQYFFSFYLLFLTEAGEQHKNCILLLDEPGLHLHGTAQGKLLQFFDKLAASGNQIIYSTHSPFLIDGDHLERARAVYETPEGTKVSDDVWPKDDDSLFPLQAALGYSICQSLFISKKQIVVEGPTDFMLLLALNGALPQDKRIAQGIIMLPIGGATNFAPFAALLSSHGVKFVAIPDADSAGKEAKVKLDKLRKLIGEDKGRIAAYDTLTGNSKIEELEDIIPEDYYIAAVAKAYPKAKLTFTKEEKSKTPSVVDRCKERVKASGEKLDKLVPIQSIVSDIHGKASAVPAELYRVAETIFANLNKLF